MVGLSVLYLESKVIFLKLKFLKKILRTTAFQLLNKAIPFLSFRYKMKQLSLYSIVLEITY